ncbi:MAG TPA: ZIP family metal transporter [Candidatus Omnitrophota bacterium]|nr:ZIP family metal transporter [Candidatus Omnitrophota bacterium]HOX09098.1 ZIP family metal transporter [Candidatus Omnitrophota bacterium]HPN66737.1 ZIP family metal transporter [Candidatus Omnitrophota bacterium]
MNALWWAIGAGVAVSVISLIGILALLFKEKMLDKILVLLIGFSAGGLLGGAFLHIIPESLEKGDDAHTVFIYVIAGFILFFILERYFKWRHCHNGVCDIHAFSYLNLIGDGIHNFIDGLIIGASFLVSVQFGLVTTFAIVLHEIPQEIGDFGVLIYGGFSKMKALLYNFISASVCIAGTVIGFFFADKIGGFSGILLPVAAGGFIYISASDLVPELHKQKSERRAFVSLAAFILGIVLMLLAKMAMGEHTH